MCHLFDIYIYIKCIIIIKKPKLRNVTFLNFIKFHLNNANVFDSLHLMIYISDVYSYVEVIYTVVDT